MQFVLLPFWHLAILPLLIMHSKQAVVTLSNIAEKYVRLKAEKHPDTFLSFPVCC